MKRASGHVIVFYLPQGRARGLRRNMVGGITALACSAFKLGGLYKLAI